MLCVRQLIVDHLCVFKQTATSSCLSKHLDDRRVLNSFIIIIIGIYDHKNRKWFTSQDDATTGGVDVYDDYPGDHDDTPARQSRPILPGGA